MIEKTIITPTILDYRHNNMVNLEIWVLRCMDMEVNYSCLIQLNLKNIIKIILTITSVIQQKTPTPIIIIKTSILIIAIKLMFKI